MTGANRGGYQKFQMLDTFDFKLKSTEIWDEKRAESSKFSLHSVPETE